MNRTMYAITALVTAYLTPLWADAPLIEAIEDAFDTTLGAPGCAAAALLPENGLWKSARGYSDRARTVPLKPDDYFCIASITKTFVAALVLRLEELTDLSVDDPLERWAPGYLDGRGITLRYLLGHTSGLRDYDTDEYTRIMAQGPPTLEQLARCVASSHNPGDPLDPLKFPPGTQLDYQNSNYVFLGIVIRNATGSPWHVSLRQHILEPLDLCDTFVHGREELPQELAGGFSEGWTYRPFGNPAGDMVSTAGDLARFMDALFHARIVNEAHLQEMLTTSSPKEEEDWLGLMIAIGSRWFPLPEPYYATAGGFMGHYSMLAYFPDSQVSVAILFNGEPRSGQAQVNLCHAIESAASEHEPPHFRRGDADAGGTVNVSDAILTLSFLFLGQGEIACRDAADANDDGAINLADGIYTLQHLFANGPPIPPPYAACDSDPIPDGLDCAEYDQCRR